MAESGKLQALGQRIRRVRLEMEMNQKDFAKLGGVSITSQQQYEAAKTPPTVEYLYRLEGVGVDIVQLLSGQCADGSMDYENSQLLEMISLLSDREKAAIMAMLTTLTGRLVDLGDPAGIGKGATLHQPGRAYKGKDDD